VRLIKIIVHYLEACNRKHTVLYPVKSKLLNFHSWTNKRFGILLNICMSGYNVAHINPFYVRLQDGTDGLIVYSSKSYKIIFGMCLLPLSAGITVVLISSWLTTVTLDKYWNGT